MWQPRFEEAIQWFEDRVEEGRLEGREPIKAEVDGRFSFDGVTLRGRADRIDQLPNGELAIVDYKTGGPPSAKQVMEGYALQLGLIAHLAQSNGFDGVQGIPTAFEYWSQARQSGKSYGYVSSPNLLRGKPVMEPSEFVAHMYEQYETAIGDWLLGDKAFTAKVAPDYAWGDYDQLMRLEEWQGG
jgi:ATP-dependent helicase/nuclease subunit B